MMVSRKGGGGGRGGREGVGGGKKTWVTPVSSCQGPIELLLRFIKE